MKADHRRLSEEQEQEYVSRDQFASRLSEYGWLTEPISRDLGEDFLVRIYDQGMSSGLGFLVQLKSVSNLDEYEIQGGYTSYRLEVGDLLHWEASAVPVFIVVWDVNRILGCWIGVPEAIVELNERRPAWRDQKTARVRIPSSNKQNRAASHPSAWAQLPSPAAIAASSPIWKLSRNVKVPVPSDSENLYR